MSRHAARVSDARVAPGQRRLTRTEHMGAATQRRGPRKNLRHQRSEVAFSASVSGTKNPCPDPPSTPRPTDPRSARTLPGCSPPVAPTRAVRPTAKRHLRRLRVSVVRAAADTSEARRARSDWRTACRGRHPPGSARTRAAGSPPPNCSRAITRSRGPACFTQAACTRAAAFSIAGAACSSLSRCSLGWERPNRRPGSPDRQRTATFPA